jgi:hypothetical protein
MFYANSQASNTNSTSAPLKTTCRAWEQGRCSRGAYCRYMHAPSPFSSPNSLSSSISEPATTSEANNNNFSLYSDNTDDWTTAFDQLSLSSANDTKNSLHSSTNMLNRTNNNQHFPQAENVAHESHHSHVSHPSTDFASSFAAAMAKKDCWDWLSGRCTRGATCKYAHSKGGVNEAEDFHTNYNHSALHYNMNNSHGNILSTPPRRGSVESEVEAMRKSKQTPLPFASASLGNELMQTTDEDVEICRFYAKHGRCKYGTTCKFIHIHPSLQTVAFLSSHFSFNQLQQAGFIDHEGNFTTFHNSHAHPSSHSAPSSLVSSPGNLSHQHQSHNNTFSSLGGTIGSNQNSSGNSSLFLSLPSRSNSVGNHNTPTRNNPPIFSHTTSQIGAMNPKYLGNYHDIAPGPIKDPFPSFNHSRNSGQLVNESTPQRKRSGQYESFFDEEYDQSYDSSNFDQYDKFFSKESNSDNDDQIIQHSTPPLHSFLSISNTQSPNISRSNSPVLTATAPFNSFYSHPSEITADFNIA